jgi:hypothetical protein
MKTLSVRTFITKNTNLLFALYLLLAANQSVGAGWQGTDDFSSASYSSNHWTFFQQMLGQMTIQVTNGHASFLEPTSTISHQQARMMWNETPTVADGWIVDILCHNPVPYGDGGSSLYLFVLDTAALGSGQIVGFTVAMGQHSGGSSFGSAWYYPGGYINRVTVPCTNNTLFGMRLVYNPGSQTIQALYDPTGIGLGWTNLDSITVSAMSPGMTATNTFSFLIVPDTFYGPISEGQMWADNFRALPTPPPLLVSGAQLTAKGNVLHLTLKNNGSLFQLQSAGALTSGWSTVSTPWTTNAGWVSTSVTNSSPVQFYRLQPN